MKKTNTKPESLDVVHAVVGLTNQIKDLENQKFFRVVRDKWNLFKYEVLRGIAYGLGTVIGATVGVSLLLFLLSKLSLFPIIGTFSSQFIQALQPK